MTESKFMKIGGKQVEIFTTNFTPTLPQYPVEVFIKPDDEDLEQFFRRVNEKVVELENKNYGIVHVLLSDLHDFDQLPDHIYTYYDEDGVECLAEDDWEDVEHKIVHHNEWTKGMAVFVAMRAILEYKWFNNDRTSIDDYIRLCYGDSRLYDELVINFN